MKSLFTRIFLWFFATVLITAAIATLVMRFSNSQIGPPFSKMQQDVELQFAEALRVYQVGGRSALASFIEDPQNAELGELLMTDSNGRDLLTGEDYSNLVAASQNLTLIPVQNRLVFVTSAQDGEYWQFLKTRTPPAFPMPGRAIWAIPIIVLSCYILARYLTAPIRKLENAVLQFGEGNFSARVGLNRRDELGRLNRTFDIMAEKIEGLVASQRQLVQDISHELRSPLMRLNIAVELAQYNGQNPKAMARIQKESDRLKTLVEELLVMSRPESNCGFSMKRAPVQLDSLLRNLVDTCKVEAYSRGCNIKLDAHSLGVVHGDEELLRRALENVLRNAILHAPLNSDVHIKANQKGASVSIHIRDHGTGVPESTLSQLFEPFYRAEGDRSSSADGIGLGLAIARRAIECHEGQIWARNAHPGLEVEINLPIINELHAEAV